MKQIVPDYYPLFSCLMGQCRHSCCIGWEIDIDEDSLNRYRLIPGEFGETLRQSIDDSGENACFRLTGDERCPFLRKDGLCEMIIRLGEDSLCQICADHPRFRNFFSDRTETGLGLCCEAAGQLILSREAPVRLIERPPENGGAALTEEEEALLALREEMIALAQDRSLPFRTRLDRLKETYAPTMPAFDPKRWAAFLLTLERLDDSWAEELSRLTEERASSDPLPEIPMEQLLVYLLFRHLPASLEDGDTTGRIAFVLLVTELLASLARTHAGCTADVLAEIARMYSSEIEYSDENTIAVIDELYALGL